MTDQNYPPELREIARNLLSDKAIAMLKAVADKEHQEMQAETPHPTHKLPQSDALLAEVYQQHVKVLLVDYLRKNNQRFQSDYDKSKLIEALTDEMLSIIDERLDSLQNGKDDTET